MGSNFLVFIDICVQGVVVPASIAMLFFVVITIYMMMLGGLERLDRELGVVINPACENVYTRRTRYFTYPWKYLFGELVLSKSSGTHIVMWMLVLIHLVLLIFMTAFSLQWYLVWLLDVINSFPHTVINELCSQLIFYGQFYLFVMIFIWLAFAPRDFGKRFIIQNFTDKKYNKTSEYSISVKYLRLLGLSAAIKAKKKPYWSGEFRPTGLVANIVMCLFIVFDVYVKIFIVGIILFFGINYGMVLLKAV